MLPLVLKSKDLRRGKWIPEEENYTSLIISNFHRGLLNLAPGTTLRQYLSQELNCDPMRITKKFTGDIAIGKCSFAPMKLSSWENLKEVEDAQKEVGRLRKIWHDKLFEQEREYLRKAQGKRRIITEDIKLDSDKIAAVLRGIQSEKDIEELIDWHNLSLSTLTSSEDERLRSNKLDELVRKGENLMRGVREKVQEFYVVHGEHGHESSDTDAYEGASEIQSICDSDASSRTKELSSETVDYSYPQSCQLKKKARIASELEAHRAGHICEHQSMECHTHSPPLAGKCESTKRSRGESLASRLKKLQRQGRHTAKAREELVSQMQLPPSTHSSERDPNAASEPVPPPMYYPPYGRSYGYDYYPYMAGPVQAHGMPYPPPPGPYSGHGAPPPPQGYPYYYPYPAYGHRGDYSYYPDMGYADHRMYGSYLPRDGPYSGSDRAEGAPDQSRIHPHPSLWDPRRDFPVYSTSGNHSEPFITGGGPAPKGPPLEDAYSMAEEERRKVSDVLEAMLHLKD